MIRIRIENTDRSNAWLELVDDSHDCVSATSSISAAYYRTTSRTTPEFTVVANTLVRESVYAFPDAVDFGKLPVGLLKANAAAPARVAQTVMVMQKGGTDFRIEVSSDLPNVEVKSDRGPAGDRYQLTVTLVGEKSQAGPVRGSLNIRTNDPDVPTLTVPVSGLLLP